MDVYPGFGGWINQNAQQPLTADPKSSGNIKSKSESGNDRNSDPPKRKKIYYDQAEWDEQDQLWHEAEKKHPWHDAPPKVKVTRKKGLCHMNIEFTMGMPPDGVYDLMTNGTAFFDDVKWRKLMEDKSVQVLKENGPRQITKVEKKVAWDFLWWSVPIPIHLIVDENRKVLKTKYKKDKIMFLKVFEGSYKVEPIYVDSERLCNLMVPKSREEYKKCSGGQGKIASKVTMNQYFQTYPLLNIPPFSWYIHWITIKTTENLLKALQNQGVVIRGADRSTLNKNTSSNKHGKHQSI